MRGAHPKDRLARLQRSYLRTECRSIDDAHEDYADLMPPRASDEPPLAPPWAPGEAPGGREPYLRGSALRAACAAAATVAPIAVEPFVLC